MNHFEITDQKGSKLIIIQTLRVHGSMSRIMLTRFTGFSRATISSIISELINNGIIQETKRQPSTGGRPATTLELVPNSVCIVGASLENYRWRIGAFDLLDNVIDSIEVPANTQSPADTFQALGDNLTSFINQLDPEPVPLLGIGVPGLVEKNGEVIINAPPFDWHNVNVAKIMNDTINWPITIINRHRARGLSECRFGSGSSYKNIIYIGVGSGIRAGFYMNRQLITDNLGGVGELGHTTVDPAGPLCSCGNEGCLQMLCSTPFIEMEIRKKIRLTDTSITHIDPNIDIQSIKAVDVCKAADKGDKLSIEVINKAANYMGISLANLVNTYNPEVIILGGTIPSSSKLFVETATKIMRRRALSSIVSDVKVLHTKLGPIGGALGAANFALDRNLKTKFL